MTERVVNFADMAFKLRGRRSLFDKDRCEHIHLTLDDNGGIVTCDDCDKQLSPFWALQHMAERWERHARENESARRRINDDAKKIIHLRAAKRVEQAWRRGMACCCPHCHKPILPEDGMGGITESREHVLERRKFQDTSIPFGCVSVIICAGCEVQDRPGARHLDKCPAAPGELIRPVKSAHSASDKP